MEDFLTTWTFWKSLILLYTSTFKLQYLKREAHNQCLCFVFGLPNSQNLHCHGNHSGTLISDSSYFSFVFLLGTDNNYLLLTLNFSSTCFITCFFIFLHVHLTRTAMVCGDDCSFSGGSLVLSPNSQHACFLLVSRFFSVHFAVKSMVRWRRKVKLNAIDIIFGRYGGNLRFYIL